MEPIPMNKAQRLLDLIFPIFESDSPQRKALRAELDKLSSKESQLTQEIKKIKAQKLKVYSQMANSPH